MRIPRCLALFLVSSLACSQSPQESAPATEPTPPASAAESAGRNVLAQALGAATAALVADGRYASTYERWFGAPPGSEAHPFPPPGAPSFPEAEGDLRKVLDAGRLRFGFALMGPPYSAEKDGSPVGWDIELGALLADVLAHHYGVDLEAVPVLLPGSPFPASLFDALEADQCDAVLSDLAITEERRQRVDFSDPYLVVTFGLLSHCAEGEPIEPARANQPQTRVIVLRHAFLNELAERYLPQAEKVFVEDPLEIPVALSEGRGDAALLPFASIRAYQKQEPELCASESRLGPEALRGIATRKVTE